MRRSFAPKHPPASWQKDPLSLETFQRLSVLLVEIGALHPWDVFGDRELFAVLDPLSGETFYNVFMGSMGTLFGLASYRGSFGYQDCVKARKNEPLGKHDEWPLRQHSMLSTFDAKNQMYEDMRDLYANIGISLNDECRYPSFIVYEPEFFPSVVSESQGKSLCFVLEQTLEICRRFLENPEGIVRPKLIFTRVSTQEGTGLVWRDEWQPPPARPEEPALSPSERALTRFITTMDRAKIRPFPVWEIDYFLDSTTASDEEGRPVFLRFSLIIDTTSKYLFGSATSYRAIFADTLLNALSDGMEKMGKPELFCVRRPELYALLKPSCDLVGQKIELRKSLPDASRAMRDFRQFLEQRRGD